MTLDEKRMGKCFLNRSAVRQQLHGRIARILQFFLLILMSFTVHGQFSYRINSDNTITIASYFSTNNGAAAIPSTTNGLPVTSIANFAFTDYGCPLQIIIPHSITDIGDDAFYRCTTLQVLSVNSLNPVYSSDNGVLLNKSKTTLIKCPEDKRGTYAIPNTVTNIKNGAFSYCRSLTDVTIPNSVVDLGESAFLKSSLKSVIIPSSISSIGAQTFSQSSLTNVIIPNSVTNIGGVAFSFSRIANITIPESVINIGQGAFFSRNLTSYAVASLNSYYSSMDGVLFDKNKATLISYPANKTGSYSIPNSVTNIEIGAFFISNHLPDIAIPDGVITVGLYAFSESLSLSSISIPNSVIKIGDDAFRGCKALKAITVDSLNAFYSGVDGVLFNEAQTTLIRYPPAKPGPPYLLNTITNIKLNAFEGCIGLTNVTIPNTVREIGFGAFHNCKNLVGVFFQGDQPYIGHPDLFNYNSTKAIVYYLPGTAGWGAYFSDRPAVLWDPRIQFNDSTFGIRTNLFGFTVSGTSNLVVVVEACSNLVDSIWSPLMTNTATNISLYFSDMQWTNYSSRFYRLRSP